MTNEEEIARQEREYKKSQKLKEENERLEKEKEEDRKITDNGWYDYSRYGWYTCKKCSREFISKETPKERLCPICTGKITGEDHGNPATD